MDATDVGADLKEVLIPAARVKERIVEMAAQIDADYAGRELLLVGVLKGAVMVTGTHDSPAGGWRATTLVRRYPSRAGGVVRRWI